MKKATRIYSFIIISAGLVTMLSMIFFNFDTLKTVIIGVLFMSMLGAVAESQSVAIDETKAITIVKQNWGEDNSVYFRCDGKTNSGRYIISVRDRNTTNALNYYEVDPETGNFDIR